MPPPSARRPKVMLKKRSTGGEGDRTVATPSAAPRIPMHRCEICRPTTAGPRMQRHKNAPAGGRRAQHPEGGEGSLPFRTMADGWIGQIAESCHVRQRTGRSVRGGRQGGVSELERSAGLRPLPRRSAARRASMSVGSCQSGSA